MADHPISKTRGGGGPLLRADRILGFVAVILSCACPGGEAHNAAEADSGEGLAQLGVPWVVLAQAGVGVAQRGDFDRALSLLRTAAERQESASAVWLQAAAAEIATQAVQREEPEAAVSALRAVAWPDPSPVFRALELRVRDLRAATTAEQLAVDREVAQLLSDWARIDPEEPADQRDSVCDHLEALYWQRYQRSDQVAHRIDALLKAWQSCEAPNTYGRVMDALQARAREAEAEGRPGDAASYLGVVIEHSRHDPGLDPGLVEEVRRHVGELLWPTYLRNRQGRFEQRLAEDWTERGVFRPETREVEIRVEVQVPADCELGQLAECTSLLDSARSTVLADLARLALEAAEMAPERMDPRPGLHPLALRLVSGSGPTAYFAGVVSLETLFRSTFEMPP